MTYKQLIALSASVWLVGCQTTNQSQSENTIEPNYKVASSQDVYDALTVLALAEEEQEVIEQIPEFDDVWERIRYQLSIPVPQNRAVVAERNYYAKHQKYIDRIAKRGEPYLYYIVEEVEKRQIPIEIALLPIVESAFDPFGYSHRSASGIWQFMPATGERFGLKQNWWYDGRRDITESTRAALEYLTYLHKTLDSDWLNAIAAYNSGEGRVLRAIQKNRKKQLPTDFWSLDLPQETTQYVPKLLALSDLLARSEEFKITWNKIANKPAVELVNTGGQIDLAKAAEMADIPVTELYKLNPAFNRWATDPTGPHKLLVPVDKAYAFKAKLAKMDAKDRIRWQQYTVKSGDSLSKIAKQFDTSSDSIKTINKLPNNTIRIGQQLFVPLSNGEIDNNLLSGPMRVAANNTANRKTTHTVVSGDSLWKISRKYKVSTKDLMKWNKLSKNATLSLGQKLTVFQPTSSTIAGNVTERTITYKVRKGDSLARIAGQYKVSVSDIMKWNGIAKNQYIQPGQRLKLKVDVKTG
ncbi:LysM peptidoglycan-binding domain-containing protein [Pseudoalteromonas sp. SSM20]|uniref:LysM peptidoglycan-binding domain-containing protein n=1 Tax=Pseudoalteromonas sp. SSM20 TaxID=3139394 RepID=UPI003BADA927